MSNLNSSSNKARKNNKDTNNNKVNQLHKLSPRLKKKNHKSKNNTNHNNQKRKLRCLILANRLKQKANLQVHLFKIFSQETFFQCYLSCKSNSKKVNKLKLKS